MDMRGRNIFFFLIIIYGRLIKPDTNILNGKNENSNGNYKGFMDLPSNSLDYLVIGSSNVFMDIDPTYIWKHYQATGYNFVSPGQPLYISKFYLDEALKTQKPKVIFLDVLGLAMYEHATESYTHLGLDYFPLSFSKLKVISELPYSKNSFIFPSLLYHSRVGELQKADFSLLENEERTNFLGYTPSYQIVPCDESLLPSGGKYITDNNIKYFNEIYQRCIENNITLVLLKTPNREWTVEMSDAVTDLAQKYGIEYIEFNSILEKIDFELSEDFCDGGKHLNYYGAIKVSRYLGNYLLENFGEAFKRKDRSTTDFYDECVYNLEHYSEVVKIRGMQSLREIMQLKENDSYLILFSGQNTTDNYRITEFLNDEFSQIIDMNTYVLLIDNENVYLRQDENSCCLEKSIGGRIFYLESNLGGLVSQSKIQVDYRNYSQQGIVNIAIYDKFYEQIVDSAYLDEKDGEIIIFRN